MRLVVLAAWRGVGELFRSDGLTHAASISYYALLSLFPFLLLLFSVIGAVTADPEARDQVITFVFQYFPRQFEFVTRQVDSFRTERVGIGIGGGLALAYASLGVFNAMSSAVNHAWGVERHRGFFRHRLFSFVMMLAAGAIFLAAIVLVSAVRVVDARWFGALGYRPGWVEALGGAASQYLGIVLLVVCVALIFRFVPHTRVRFRDVWPGAILTALLWRLALSLFSAYAADPARWSVHGSVAAVVVFLLWIYVSAVLLLYGVEMTAAYVRLQQAARRHPALAVAGVTLDGR
ncbi:MAG: YihY/virulence factor BrkB family protein [Vicinamibacterales bacterium]